MARIQRMFPAAYKFVPPTWVGLWDDSETSETELTTKRLRWAAEVIPDDFPDLEKRFGDNPESKASDPVTQWPILFGTWNVVHCQCTVGFCTKCPLGFCTKNHADIINAVKLLSNDTRLHLQSWRKASAAQSHCCAMEVFYIVKPDHLCQAEIASTKSKQSKHTQSVLSQQDLGASFSDLPACNILQHHLINLYIMFVLCLEGKVTLSVKLMISSILGDIDAQTHRSKTVAWECILAQGRGIFLTTELERCALSYQKTRETPSQKTG